ncbi:MAG: hypothetical protein GIW95_12780, partial [Candidatus Eremiobacteraeota bacterium]|nr:hypothetical protein [Candidatus Eremiobacteraeota bacterium]
MFVFPATLAPPPPFPTVAASALRTESVVPGNAVSDATYWMKTADGPLIVHVVAVDARAPNIRLGAVLAADRMISKGETVSAMAARTGAIAGVNADYYDIGQTNQPLNILVRDGLLQRTPSLRAALFVMRDGSVRFANGAFRGSVRYGDALV